ncbi:MAG: HNH endonuclease [Polaromonas sp.]|nr:HNH endonuclease [Polaromonas sp.]
MPRAPSVDWTRQHLLPTLHLYTQMPFGQLDARNAKVKQLARWLGRSPGSVSMKLNNLSSLDPVIAARGLSGLPGASALDRVVWAEFHANWDAMATEAEQEYARLAVANGEPLEAVLVEAALSIPEGKTRTASVQVRINQWKFRKSILANYSARCCISGLSSELLLNVSHIVPWSRDVKNRMNPQNGLCLSALHDRAYDIGLITVMPDFRVRVSEKLQLQTEDAFMKQSLLRFNNKKILMPARYGPDPAFLESHARRFGFI